MHENPRHRQTRRAFIQSAAAAVALTACGRLPENRELMPKVSEAQKAQKRKGDSVVGVWRCESYEEDLAKIFKQNSAQLGLPDLKGKTAILKPNMIEYRPGKPITVNGALIKAGAELADYLGAKEIVVAEGPGHFRDVEYLLEMTGIGETCKKLGLRFVDLNLDDIEPLDNPLGFTGLDHIYLPKTVLNAGAVISLPKLKTHHWVGMTASMKNLFGVVPGRKYGWPKDMLHFRGIPRSIIDLALLVKPSFTLVDSIVGMEGEGPIAGTAIDTGLIMAGTDLAAVDATCARIMNLKPEVMTYLRLAGEVVGNIDEKHINVIGCRIDDVKRNYKLPHNQTHLREDAQAAQKTNSRS